MNKKWIVLGSITVLVVLFIGYFIGTHQRSNTTVRETVKATTLNATWDDVAKSAKKNNVLIIFYSPDAKKDIEKTIEDAESQYPDNKPTILWSERYSLESAELIKNSNKKSLKNISDIKPSSNGAIGQLGVAIDKTEDIQWENIHSYEQVGVLKASGEYIAKNSNLVNFFYDTQNQEYVYNK